MRLLCVSLLFLTTTPVISSIPDMILFPTPGGVSPVPVLVVCYATEFGARQGHKVDSTGGIQAAIDHCSEQVSEECVSGECVGVTVLDGVGEDIRFRSGALYLRSYVVLVLMDGVKLEAWGVEEWAWPSLYRRVEGVMTMGTASLINAGICKDLEYKPGVVVVM